MGTSETNDVPKDRVGVNVQIIIDDGATKVTVKKDSEDSYTIISETPQNRT